MTTVRHALYHAAASVRTDTGRTAALPWGKTADRIGLVVLTTIGLVLGVLFATARLSAIDAHLFWEAGHRAHYYTSTWSCADACSYLYPPPFAQLAGLLTWAVYIIPWTLLLFVAWWVVLRTWSLPAFLGSLLIVTMTGYTFPLSSPLLLMAIGNPQILIAAVCVIGFRYPGAWAFVLLTKIAPGVGVLWFAVRHEWRYLGIALGATAAIAAISLVLAPGTWVEYAGFAIANASAVSPLAVVPVPFLVRLPMAMALIVWGARTDRRWTVPIAVGWSSLAFYDWTYLTVWMAAILLARRPSLAPALPKQGPRHETSVESADRGGS
jgi:hypothetical protein